MKDYSSRTDGSRADAQARQPGRGSSNLGGLVSGLFKGNGSSGGILKKVLGGALLAAGVAYVATRKKSDSNKQAATLDELLHFVNDRIEGYQRAVDESHDPQLRGYYKQLVSQSQQFSTDLNTYLTQEGGERETSTTLKGKLYRGWMDAKALLTARDEEAILQSNIYGEEWALKAYKDALADQTLSGAMRQAVERQYILSQKTYAQLQKLEAKQ